VAGAFDLAAGENACAVGENQKGQEHGGWELFATGAAMVDLGRGGVDELDGVDDEMDEVVGRNPVAHIGGEEHGGVAVDVDESWHIKLPSKN
jgi:hypothetical protein